MNSRNIVVLEPFSDTNFDLINSVVEGQMNVLRFPRDISSDELKSVLKTAEVVIGQPPVDLIKNPSIDCPNLKLIQMTWAGTDIYTRESIPFPKDRIALCNASGSYGHIISQYVVALVLSLMLNLPGYHCEQLNSNWKRLGAIKSLDNANVLIYGAGDIGSFTAKRLQSFNVHIVGVCKNTSKKREYFDELCTLEESINYLESSDVIICCIPGSDETDGFLNNDRLKLIKEGAVLVNVGRGGFIDADALNDCLNSGRLWGAALDVTNPEPLPDYHPLWKNPRALITPHITGVSFGHLKETEDIICKICSDNIRHYLNNEKLINQIF